MVPASCQATHAQNFAACSMISELVYFAFQARSKGVAILATKRVSQQFVLKLDQGISGS